MSFSNHSHFLQLTLEGAQFFFTLINEVGESERPIVLVTLSPVSLDMYDWSTPKLKIILQV